MSQVQLGGPQEVFLVLSRKDLLLEGASRVFYEVYCGENGMDGCWGRNLLWILGIWQLKSFSRRNNMILVYL